MLPSPSWPLHLDFSFLWLHKYLATKPVLQESYSTFGFRYPCVKHNAWRHHQSLLSPSRPIKSLSFVKKRPRGIAFLKMCLQKCHVALLCKGNFMLRYNYSLKNNWNSFPWKLPLKCTRFVQMNNSSDSFCKCVLTTYTQTECISHKVNCQTCQYNSPLHFLCNFRYVYRFIVTCFQLLHSEDQYQIRQEYFQILSRNNDDPMPN